MKYLPGPWKIEKHSGVDKDFAIRDQYDNEVCRLDFDDVDHKEVNATAKLIAKAPALLDFIKEVSELHPDGNPQELITKATQIIKSL